MVDEKGRYHLFSQLQFTSFKLGAKVINLRKWFFKKLLKTTQGKVTKQDSPAPTSSSAGCSLSSHQEKPKRHSPGARNAGCCASGPPCCGWWCRSPSLQRSCCSNSGSAPHSGSGWFWTLPLTWPQNMIIHFIRTTRHRPVDWLHLKLKGYTLDCTFHQFWHAWPSFGPF